MTRRRPFTACATVGLTLALLAFSGCDKKNSGGAASPKNSLVSTVERIRQAGEPVSLPELNAWYSEPAAGENAAPLYAEAFAALAVTDSKSPTFLTQNQPALALLHKAAAKPQCRYPVDLAEGANAKLVHLAKLKTCAQLLSQDAVATAGKGRMDLAAQDVLSGLGLAGSLEQEPLLISQLVRVSCEAIAQTGLESALASKPFTEEQLARLQTAIRVQEQKHQPALTRSYMGERCSVISLFQMPLTDYQRLCGAGGTNFPFGTPADFAQYRRSAGGQSDFALALNFFSNWLSIVSMPLPAGLDTADQWSSEARSLVAEAKTKGYRVSALMLPALNTTMERAVDGMAQSRVAQVALAVERFRVAGSSLPDSLAQLVPKYLPAVPEDPYDGKPVRYNKLSPKGYVVYSVGRNRRDDGGATRPMGGQADGPYDLVFAVRR